MKLNCWKRTKEKTNINNFFLIVLFFLLLYLLPSSRRKRETFISTGWRYVVSLSREPKKEYTFTHIYFLLLLSEWQVYFFLEVRFFFLSFFLLFWLSFPVLVCLFCVFVVVFVVFVVAVLVVVGCTLNNLHFYLQPNK